MAYGLTNVKGITNEEIEAVEEILNDLITLLGATNNTGGTVSAGTVMAKLNKLLTDWTATRAGYIDAINTNAARLTSTRAGYIDKLANFGATGDTGGTASAGTVMAKVNKILTDWTTARAGRIDTINNAIGATGDTGGTTSAGTVMAKVNKLLTDWTATRAGYIDTINTNAARMTSARATKIDNIGATGDTGGSATAGTLMAKLNKLLSTISSGIGIKSVQRGKLQCRGGSTNITISNIKPDKSFVILNISNAEASSFTRYAYVENLTSTTLTINGFFTSDNITVGWQVIEFY